MPVIEILRRAVTRMAEILVLGIPYFEQASMKVSSLDTMVLKGKQ